MAKKSIIRRIDRNLARRLKEARREVGMSTRAVAAKLPSSIRVSHATIAKYENGVSVPPINVLAALATFYERPLNWFMDSRKSLSDFQLRNIQSRVPLSDQRTYAAQASKWAEAYLALEGHLSPHREFRSESAGDTTPIELATRIRLNHLNLDDSDPVLDTVAVLESFSSWAIEVRPTFKVDGAAASCSGKPVVIVNPDVSNERIRLNAAYELGIMLFSQGGTDLVTEVESKAYEFATSLLLPDTQVAEAFESKSFLKLIEYKERFGVSLAAMLHRAEELRVINTSASRWLRSEMAKRGWRKSEPGYVWKDRAVRFETLLESAIYGKRLTWEDAERVTSIPENDLKSRLQSVYACAKADDEDDEGSDEPITLKIVGA